MVYGIICAMDQEIALLREDLQQAQSISIADRIFYQGTLYGKDVVLVESHIGKVAAALTTALLIHQFEVDLVFCSGTAGGIHPDLRIGDAVVADNCLQHDFKLPEAWGPAFRIPDINLSYIPTDKALVERAHQAVERYMKESMLQDIPVEYQQQFGMGTPRVVVGTIASGDEFIHTKDRVDWLTANIDNLGCAEMESAAIAQVCYSFNTPFVVVRVISDCANSVVDFDTFIEHAARHFTRGVMKAVLEQ